MSFNTNTEEEKILSLLYSGVPANDLIALEIIKSSSYIDSFIPVLIAIIGGSKDKEHGSIFFEFLKSRLNDVQRIYLERHLHSTNDYGLYPLTLKKTFTQSLATEIIYAHHKRTNEASGDFLMIDQGTHPKRQEVFNSFLTHSNMWANQQHLSILGLLPEEMERYLAIFFTKNQHTSFYALTLESLKSPEVPAILFSKNFKQVNINFNYSKPFFPDFIFRFKGLKKLSFPIDQDTRLSEDWSSLSSLEELSFSGEQHIFQEFNFLNSLPKLKTLTIYYHYLSNPAVLLSKKKLPLSGHIRFQSVDGYSTNERGHIFMLPQKQVLAVGTALGKSILSLEEKEYFFKKIIKNAKIKNLEPLPIGELLVLMNVNYAGIRSVVQEQIDTLSEKQKGIDTLNEKSLLYIAGSPGRKRTEIKQQLKDLKIPLASDPSEAITHLVICKGPKEYKQLQDRDLQLVSEQALYQLFKKEAPGFLEEAEQSGDSVLTDNVLQFLYSDEVSNVAVGLEMLKTGGVPAPLIDPLLVVYKTCPDSKMRGVAKKLLDRHAPAELIPLISDSQRFTNFHQKVKAQEVNKKLEKIARTTSRQLAAKLALLFHGRYKKGLRYVLYHFHETSTERSQALMAMVEGTHFDFAAGLGFTSHKNKDPEGIILFKMKTAAKFPIDIVDNVPLIETANFHNCKFTSLPTNIGDLKDLKELDLSHNFLGSIPKSIEQMTQLESLNLQMNAFKKFPMTLRRLKNLKFLDLRHNRVDNNFTPVEIPEEVREALGDCEILV